MTPMVIEIVTFRLLDQCLNRMRHRVSHIIDFKLMVNRAVGGIPLTLQTAGYTDQAEEPHGVPQTGHINAQITPQSN
jgi:hypothetical protein